MLLEGSCHCGAVKFAVQSPHPYPYMLCYCSICRKTAGGGGYAINLSGDYNTMKVEGDHNVAVYRAMVKDRETGTPKQSTAYRNFCSKCGSALWVWSPTWPDLVHPHASAIDSELPIPPERTHILLDSKASWTELHADPQDETFDKYPNESIAAWHERLNLEVE